MADAPASDVVIHLVAEHVRWDTDTITAPAGATWTLEFENRDGQPEHHNFTIVNGPAVTDRIFMTPNLQGPATERYVIPGLPSGTYEFVCTVHPDGMRGTLVVE
jgi:plastocyanin